MYEISEDSVVYAGIVITCKTEDTLAKAKTVLQSREFLDDLFTKLVPMYQETHSGLPQRMLVPTDIND